MNRFVRALRVIFLFAWLISASAHGADTARQTIVRAALAENATEKRQLIGLLMGQADPAIASLLEAWRVDALFVYTAPDGTKIPVQLSGEKDANGAQPALRIDTGAPLLDLAGQPLRLVGADLVAVEHNAALRRAMKAVLDLADLAAPAPATRLTRFLGIDLCRFVSLRLVPLYR